MQIWSVSSFDKLEKVVLFNFNFEILQSWELTWGPLGQITGCEPINCTSPL